MSTKFSSAQKIALRAMYDGALIYLPSDGPIRIGDERRAETLAPVSRSTFEKLVEMGFIAGSPNSATGDIVYCLSKVGHAVLKAKGFQ